MFGGNMARSVPHRIGDGRGKANANGNIASTPVSPSAKCVMLTSVSPMNFESSKTENVEDLFQIIKLPKLVRICNQQTRTWIRPNAL
jgi:hypothetical protein